MFNKESKQQIMDRRSYFYLYFLHKCHFLGFCNYHRYPCISIYYTTPNSECLLIFVEVVNVLPCSCTSGSGSNSSSAKLDISATMTWHINIRSTCITYSSLRFKLYTLDCAMSISLIDDCESSNMQRRILHF